MEKLTSIDENGEVLFAPKGYTIIQLIEGGHIDLLNEIAHRLAKYENLEEQGLIKNFPCKLGEPVYYLTGKPGATGDKRFDKVCQSKAIGFYICSDGIMIQLDCDWKGNHGTYGYFGKTVFLTQPEADEMLKKWVI